MVFSAPIFLFLFLPLTLLLYTLLPQAGRNLLLTVASLLFYAWGELDFLPLLILSVILNYYFALWISDKRGTTLGKVILTLGIASDLLLLLYFKYIGFAVGTLNFALALVHVGPPLPMPSVSLPLGISFFTFHKISYKVDVYRGDAAAKRNPLDLALYILFFPQLIAGPIVRFNEVADQIATNARRLSKSRFVRGITLFIIGLAKKTLIANVVALPTDRIFSLPVADLYPALSWTAILCYAIQIYFDFSGYSDMAVGLACIFGFDFPANFRYPYIAESVTEFWRRWHMSLSRWFRDYLYIPLGGNRVSPVRTYVNLTTVFLLCGLWHGAALTFVFWGIYHGVFLAIERAFLGDRLTRLPRILRHLYLIVVILLGWVLFRSPSLHYAKGYLWAMLGLSHGNPQLYPVSLYLDAHSLTALLVGILGSTPIWLWLRRSSGIPYDEPEMLSVPVFHRRLGQLCLFAGLTTSLFLALLSVAGGTYDPFIYFRF